jgi:hypothetical protein
MAARTKRARKTMTEEVQVASGELVDRVKTLLAEGRVRHIRVKSPTGEIYFELPLTVGVLGGAALAFASPWLAMAASLAGLVASVKLEIVRENDEMVAVVEPKLQRESAGGREPLSAPRLTGQSPRQRTSPAKGSATARKPAARVAKTRPRPTTRGGPAAGTPSGGRGKRQGRR